MPVRTSFGPIQRPVTYLFVDAGHLKANFADIAGRWFGDPEDLDVSTLHGLFAADKVFYYDSIDDVARAGETADQLDARVRQQEASLRDINAIRNVHVRYGSITGRDRRKRRQKEVDILIAVDMMNHAFRQNMDRAVLLTGDRDFTPLVETLVQYGLTIEVAGDFRSTSDILREAADYYRPLALQEYASMVTARAQRNKPPFPEIVGAAAPVAGDAQVIASGPIGIGRGSVLPIFGGVVLQYEEHDRTWHVKVTSHDALDRLRLYLSLQYGEVPWMQFADAAYFP